jgi:flagellar motor switch protein FliM
MDEQILTQDEVDALLQGISGESDRLDPERDAAADGTRSYDLLSQERMVRERMPTLEIVNERFGRNIRTGIFSFLHKSPEVSVGPVRVHKFSAFLREIAVPTNFNIVSVRPLRGLGLVVCDPSLVFAVIDTLFGGAGKFPSRIEGRDFSATEQRVIRRLVDVILADWKRAWEGLYPLELEYQRSEMQPQFANIATPGEMVVSTTFTLEIGDTTGGIHFCIPYATFEPMRDVLYSAPHGDTNGPDRRWVELLTQQIQAAQVELVAELAQAEATVEQVLALKAGDFIELDLSPAIQARVCGVPVCECHYGTSNGRYALRVDQMLPSAVPDWRAIAPAGGG